MQVYNDQVCLKDLCFSGKHGMYDEEKLREQPFRVQLAMTVDTSQAALTDDLAHTVDYSRVYLKIKQLVEHESYGLIETLAARIAAVALAEPAVAAVRVEVEKLRAMAAGASFTSAVVIERSKEDGKNLP